MRVGGTEEEKAEERGKEEGKEEKKKGREKVRGGRDNYLCLHDVWKNFEFNFDRVG